MNTAVDELREAADSLAIAAAGKTSGCFSVSERRSSTSRSARSSRKRRTKGISAIDKFIMIGNDGLTCSSRPWTRSNERVRFARPQHEV